MSPISSLETIAYHNIRERMMRADFMPGTLLSENELAGVLGMSRTPVRAAISLLEREGLVESFKGRGVVVKEVSVHDFSEMYEILVSMQLFVLDTAIKRKLSFDLAGLSSILEQQQRAMAEDDYYGYYIHSLLFVEGIVRTIRNESMVQIVELYRSKYVFRAVAYRKQYPQYKPNRSAQTNAKIFAALQSGDVPGAKMAVLEQYTEVHEQVMMGGLMK